MVKLRNNKIEERAVKYVLEKLGNGAKDVRDQRCGYDIKYRDKIIEVKGTQSLNWKQNIFFSRSQEYAVWENNKNKYILYRVYNIKKYGKAIKDKKILGKYLEPKEDPRWSVKIKKGNY